MESSSERFESLEATQIGTGQQKSVGAWADEREESFAQRNGLSTPLAGQWSKDVVAGPARSITGLRVANEIQSGRITGIGHVVNLIRTMSGELGSMCARLGPWVFQAASSNAIVAASPNEVWMRIVCLPVST
jgi:hypothetical protein